MKFVHTHEVPKLGGEGRGGHSKFLEEMGISHLLKTHFMRTHS